MIRIPFLERGGIFVFVQWVLVAIYDESKKPGSEAYRSPLFSAQVKNGHLYFSAVTVAD
jgi:hypothetical protein